MEAHEVLVVKGARDPLIVPTALVQLAHGVQSPLELIRTADGIEPDLAGMLAFQLAPVLAQVLTPGAAQALFLIDRPRGGQLAHARRRAAQLALRPCARPEQ